MKLRCGPWEQTASKKVQLDSFPFNITPQRFRCKKKVRALPQGPKMFLKSPREGCPEGHRTQI